MTLQDRPVSTATSSQPPDAADSTRAPWAVGDGAQRGALERGSVRWALVVALPVVAAALAAWWTPRGPLTTAEALVTMAAACGVGVLVGVLARSRWTILAAPALFAAVFELLRMPVDGPTVDGIHLSTYGVLAFLTGRVVHGMLALLPMMLGASLGAALSRRRARVDARPDGRASRVLRRTTAGLTGLALVALAAFLAVPATTDPILDANGEVVAGSIAELTSVDVGDHELAIMLRGRSVENPVLLFLAGGPGGSELGAMRRHSQALEDHFVVATLDQRGTGRSYAALDPADTLTPEAAVDDVVAVTSYLQGRFGEERVYLVGQSWGSILGVLAVQQAPESYAAFVGVGQTVSPSATDRIFYADTLAWAREQGDDDLVATLEENGPPPYDDLLDNEPAFSHEKDVHPYDHSPNAEGAGQMGENIIVEEYSLLDKLHVFAATLDVFGTLYPQIQDIDLREQARSLDVPVYLVQGAHEAPGRAVIAEEWFGMLEAPHKEMFVFDTSGHRPLWEQPDEFHDVMTTVVLDAATT